MPLLVIVLALLRGLTSVDLAFHEPNRYPSRDFGVRKGRTGRDGQEGTDRKGRTGVLVASIEGDRSRRSVLVGPSGCHCRACLKERLVARCRRRDVVLGAEPISKNDWCLPHDQVVIVYGVVEPVPRDDWWPTRSDRRSCRLTRRGRPKEQLVAVSRPKLPSNNYASSLSKNDCDRSWDGVST
jgi:hypothetical protein